MLEFKKNLEALFTSISGSTISVQSPACNFSCTSPGVTEQSQFYIGSISKQMTAYLFLNALQRRYPDKDLNELLNVKLTDIFPDSALLKKIGKAWINEVTPYDLLTHQSGLSDYVAAYEQELENPQALNEAIDASRILQAATFDAAKPYQYSNTNYFLLGKLTEEIEGAGFEKIFELRVKQPAKMGNAFAPTKGNYHSLKQRRHFANLVPDLNNEIFMDMANAIGAGNIIASSADLLKWNEFLHFAIHPKIKEILLEKHLQDEDGDWIHMGLSTSQTECGPLIGFQGSQDSYGCFVGYLGKQNVHLVILSNHMDSFEKILQSFQDFTQSSNTCDDAQKTGEPILFSANSQRAPIMSQQVQHTENQVLKINRELR